MLLVKLQSDCINKLLKFLENLQPHNLIYQETPQKIVASTKVTTIL